MNFEFRNKTIPKSGVDFDDCKFIVCGDLNSGILNDYVELDSADHVPLPDDYVADYNTYPVRHYQDKRVYGAGRRLINVYVTCVTWEL